MRMVYPLSMFLRVLAAAQLLILIFVKPEKGGKQRPVTAINVIA